MKFQLSEYSNFLSQMLDDGYICMPFSDPRAKSTTGRHLLLRHDVDIDPCAATAMAMAEDSVGARSTFFILLSSRHTNPLDHEFRRAVRTIAELGHWIGLHFDATQYGLSVDDLNFSVYVQREVELLEWSCGVEVDSVSFHRPAKELLSSSGSLTAPLVHTYEHVFIREIEYCSDSSGRWAYGPPQEREAHKLGKPFHLLTHPMWWGDSDVEPIERIQKWMASRVRDDFSYELPDYPNPFGENQ